MRLIKIKENILTMIKKVGNQSREIKKHSNIQNIQKKKQIEILKLKTTTTLLKMSLHNRMEIPKERISETELGQW